MENKYERYECPKYEEHAREDALFGNKKVFCDAICPYDKEIPVSLTSWGGGLITLCKSDGLLKKEEIDNPNLEKTENKPYAVLPEQKFDGKLPTGARYFQFKITKQQNQPSL